MKQLHALAIVALILNCIVYVGCQKEVNDPGPEPTNPPPQIEYVKAAITGRIVDDQNMPVSGAAVKAGSANSTTDINGEFKLNNVTLNKDAGFVKVEKDGFFQSSRTFSVTANATHFVTIQLIKKTAAGTFSAANGGNVTIANGGAIQFPATAIVNETGNASYNGTVTVQAYFIDPSANYFREIMPGTLRGINLSNQQVGLQSFGMMAVELRGANGEKLQLASGKQATVTFPIPAAMQGLAPANIPLWNFIDSTGLWKEEGTANKQGNNYVGSVSHFSFWNCDAPFSLVEFQAIIKDQSNNPVEFAKVVIEDISIPSINGYEYTTLDGHVWGKIPAGKSLKLTIYNKCGSQIHSQNISPFTTSANLGTISVSAAGTMPVTFTGNVLNCSGAAVTNGFVNIKLDNTNYRAALNNGAFSVTIHRCSNNATTAEVQAIDVANTQQGAVSSIAVNGSNIATGTLTACTNPLEEYINYTFDGVNYLLEQPVDSLRGVGHSMVISQNHVYGFPMPLSNSRYVRISWDGPYAPGMSDLTVIEVRHNGVTYWSNAAPSFMITEFGPNGAYMAGSVTWPVVDENDQNNIKSFSCSFRVKREDD